MCDEVFDDCLAALKFIPDWLVRNKMVEIFMMLYLIIMIYSSFYENFSKVTVFGKNWIFLVYILIKLTLQMTIIFKKMILTTLLFMSDFWLGVINVKNAKHLKKI